VQKVVVRRVKEKRNILRTVQRRRAKWIGHVLRRECLLKYVIEGKIKERGRRDTKVTSYCMTIRKRTDAVNGKRKHC
jgi:hypothetical protein